MLLSNLILNSNFESLDENSIKQLKYAVWNQYQKVSKMKTTSSFYHYNYYKIKHPSIRFVIIGNI